MDKILKRYAFLRDTHSKFKSDNPCDPCLSQYASFINIYQKVYNAYQAMREVKEVAVLDIALSGSKASIAGSKFSLILATLLDSDKSPVCQYEEYERLEFL